MQHGSWGAVVTGAGPKNLRLRKASAQVIVEFIAGEGIRMQLLTCESFAGRAGESFDVAMGDGSIQMTLAEVTPLPARTYPGMMRAPFSLIFRSTTPVVLPQRMYRLKNQSMGALDVFLVPIGRDVGGTVYQAVFN